MSDDAEDTLDERLESIQRRAQNFRELLRDGEEVTIAFLDGDVHVAESYRSKFEREHPRLFGRMLSIAAQMDAGLSPYVVGLIVAGALIFCLQMGWLDGVLGEGLSEALTGWWFYIVLPLVLAFFTNRLCAWRERWVYRRNRRDLLAMIAADELDRDEMLVILRDEGDVEDVVHHLKLDTAR